MNGEGERGRTLGISGLYKMLSVAATNEAVQTCGALGATMFVPVRQTDPDRGGSAALKCFPVTKMREGKTGIAHSTHTAP